MADATVCGRRFFVNVLVGLADGTPMPRRSPALVLVHVVWATAHRAPVLAPTFDSLLSAILGAKALSLNSLLLGAGGGCDHVHVVLQLAPTASLADVVQRLKGGSSYDAARLTTGPTIIRWQPGYWAESLSPADLDPLLDYVRAQRLHHDDSHPAENWMHEAKPGEGGL